jgi:AraC-like DNA-binding protein
MSLQLQSLPLRLHPRLEPWVERLWLHQAERSSDGQRELCLPSAQMQLVLRLDGPPARRFTGLDDKRGTALPRAVLCGLRRVPVMRSCADQGVSLGVSLKPGACQRLLGLDAGQASDRYLPVAERMPLRARLELARIDRASDPRVALQDWLLGVLANTPERAPERAAGPPMAGLHGAAEALEAGASVADLVTASGLSHRTWLTRFRALHGCTPRELRALRRFGRCLQGLHATPRAPLSALALEHGYADQPHFQREFLRFAQLTPGAYRGAQSRWPNHVPLA